MCSVSQSSVHRRYPARSDGIWESQKTDIPGYPFDIQSHPAIIPENDIDSPEKDAERRSDSDF